MSKIAAAMRTISKKMEKEPDYAWVWHCNIAMLMVDEGVDHKKANERAATFMNLAFDVDTSKNEFYQYKEEK